MRDALAIYSSATSAIALLTPRNHPWRRTDPPALCLLGCIARAPVWSIIANATHSWPAVARHLRFCRLASGTRDIIKKAAVGHDKPDTGHCSLKQLAYAVPSI
jgi:hypothetical protein